MGRHCVFEPRLDYCTNVSFALPALACLIVALIAGLTFWDINSTTFTTCYPVSYSSDVGLCWEGIYGEDGPWPVEGWVEFLYYNSASRSNKTVNYQMVCGNSLQGAIDRGREKYPYMEPIVCGWKASWADTNIPVRLFRNGKPWDQVELLISSVVCLIIMAIIYTICVLFKCRYKSPEEIGAVKEVESLLV